MTNYGVILQKLRTKNQLTLKQAAKVIGRSAGWLSEIENNRGAARIDVKEFDRIVSVYGGDKHRKYFNAWIATKGREKAKIPKIEIKGSILKHLRKKAQIPLSEVSKELNLSISYLSYLENGLRPLSNDLRDKLLNVYGYSPSSFKNFTTKDKRSQSIPVKYKLNSLISQLEDRSLNEIYEFAINQFSKEIKTKGIKS